MLPLNVLYTGTAEPLPEQVPLRAGPLTLVYEAGDLRYVRLRDREVVRRLYVAVRDRNWATIPAALSNVQLDRRDDSFRITYDARHQQGEIDFTWRAEIEGDPDGTICFRIDGEARSTFLRNRIGFCVLHPVRELAGQPCRVEHDGGEREETAFPQRIAPDDPFLEMRSLSHEVIPGVRATLRFEGDLFETEDQRNWTDASYKTFCTPLRLPYPVEITAGTRVRQSVTLTFTGLAGAVAGGEGASAGDASTAIRVTLDSGGARSLPRIGLGSASHGRPLTDRELRLLGGLRPAHLRVDLELAAKEWRERLREATRQARALGIPLEAAVILSDAGEEELGELSPVLEEVKPSVWTWLVLHRRELCAGERWVRAAAEVIRRYDPEARIGSGSHANFTELNRGQPPLPLLDEVCYSINPQIHAFDNASLVETLEAQAMTVESARTLAGGLPVAVTPVTLKQRFNAVATGPETEPAPGELPGAVDSRQMSLFGAGWTVGSIKYLAESGAASVTYYETTGWRGVMETEAGSPVPERFRSLPGGVFPLYHVLADVGGFVGGEVMPSRSSEPLAVEALALRREGLERVIVANLTPREQSVRLEGVQGSCRVRVLDETNAEDATRSPSEYRGSWEVALAAEGGLRLTLQAFAVATVDWGT